MTDRFAVKDADPNYRYRWCNTRERTMLGKLDVGWEIVKGPSELPPEVASALGQSTEAPAGGTTRTRGDLILMRIHKDLYEERVEKPRRAAAERQGVSLDTMVQQANEQAKRALKDKGYKDSQIRDALVFQDSDRPGFDSTRK